MSSIYVFNVIVQDQSIVYVVMLVVATRFNQFKDCLLLVSKIFLCDVFENVG